MKEEEDKKEEEKKHEENKEETTKHNKVTIEYLKKEFDTLITQSRREEQEYNQLKFAIGKANSREIIGNCLFINVFANIT